MTSKQYSFLPEFPSFQIGDLKECLFCFKFLINPFTTVGQKVIGIFSALLEMKMFAFDFVLNPSLEIKELPVKRFYRYVLESRPTFAKNDGSLKQVGAKFERIPPEHLFTLGLDDIQSWVVMPIESVYDLDNVRFTDLAPGTKINSVFELKNILVEGHCTNIFDGSPPRGLQFSLAKESESQGTIVMANLGYFQLKANPGEWSLLLREGRSKDLFEILSDTRVYVDSFSGSLLNCRVRPKQGKENEPLLVDGLDSKAESNSEGSVWSKLWGKKQPVDSANASLSAELNIFSVASGHLYERFLSIMILSVLAHTKSSVKFWFIENFLSPVFKVHYICIAVFLNIRSILTLY